jgi:hypothetical protein
MLIKRILLVALVATATMNCLGTADVSSLVQYGVQSNSISEDNARLLIQQAKEVDDWNNPKDLAVSSIVRAQFTNGGDTTLEGINRGVLNGSPEDLKDLIRPEKTKEQRQLIANKILSEAPAAGASAGASASAAPASRVWADNYHAWLQRWLSERGIAASGNTQADVNLSNAAGVTPLMNAASNGLDDVVEFLLDMGANPNLVMQGGDTAETLAQNDTIRSLIRSRS